MLQTRKRGYAVMFKDHRLPPTLLCHRLEASKWSFCETLSIASDQPRETLWEKELLSRQTPSVHNMEISLLQARPRDRDPRRQPLPVWRDALRSPELWKWCVRESRKRKGTCPRLGRMNLKMTEKQPGEESRMCVADCTGAQGKTKSQGSR